MTAAEREIVSDARAELGAALMQVLDSDDRIIVDHMRTAYAVLGVVLKLATREGSDER